MKYDTNFMPLANKIFVDVMSNVFRSASDP